MSIVQALNDSKNEFNDALGKQKGSALDKDSFMLLLVTQFKYQDPLNPMEDKEFIAQLAQFSSLEQLMTMNESMDSLTEATYAQQMLNATSYIGKTVLAKGSTISKEGDAITSYSYAFEGEAAKGVIYVYDKNNQSVFHQEFGAKQGGTEYDFTWTGKNDLGMTMPDGVYRVAVALTDADGKPILPDSQVEGVVSGVRTENGVTYLKFADGRTLPLASVREVRSIKTTKPDEEPDEKPGEKPGEDPKPTPHVPTDTSTDAPKA